MTLFDAIVPIVIADAVILLSFFDDRIIKPKVLADLTTASHLTEEQKEYIVRICSGASTLLMYFANLSVIIATAIIGIELVPHEQMRVTLIALSVIAVPIIYFGYQFAVRFRLSDIDDVHIIFWLTRGDLLRITLLLLNAAVILMLVAGISSTRPGSPPPEETAHHGH